MTTNYNLPGVQLLTQGAVKRRLRTPSHQFYLEHRPWQIQPFAIAPVLPGETMKKAVLQARVVSDPIKHALTGWWCEHYLFYVKLRDLYARDLLTQMLLDPAADLSSLDAVSDPLYYHQNGAANAINWPKMCVARIVDEYFRSEGEVSTDYTLNGLPTAAVNINNALDSACKSLDDDTSVDMDLTSTTAGQGDATAKVWTSEIQAAMQKYLFALQNKTTDMTFEDWCEQFGVSMPKEELLRPELVRYWKDWTYPTNTIDPSNGTPRSAVSWSVQGSADKDRLFKEPGFLCGVTVVRPKVFFAGMQSHMTMLMRDAFSWLPAPLAQDPRASWVKVGAADNPLPAASATYEIDIKDLFLYGDQFINKAMSFAAPIYDTVNMVKLPSADMTNTKYPSSVDADKLFVTDTAGTGMVKQDGILTLHILGRQIDTSPNSVGGNKTV